MVKQPKVKVDEAPRGPKAGEVEESEDEKSVPKEQTEKSIEER